MAKTETLHIRVEPALKANVDATLRDLGLSTAEAVNIFLHQVLLHNGLPFNVTKPTLNATTLAALDAANQDHEIHGPFHSVAAVMEDLNAPD